MKNQKNRTLAALALFVFFAVIFVASRPPARAGSMRVEKIIKKHVDALGGLEKIKAIHAVKVTGRLEQSGFEFPLTLWMKRPNKSRMLLSIRGYSIVQAYDGKTAWWVNPLRGSSEPEEMPPVLAKVLLRWVDFDGPLVEYKRKGHRVKYEGIESVKEGKAYKLKITLAGGGVSRAYIDAQSYMEVRRTYMELSGKGEREVATTFADYRDVGGVRVPGVIEGEGLEGVPYRIVFDHYEMNPAIEDGMFARPRAGAQGRVASQFVELSDFDPVLDRFNEDDGHVRLFALLSPN